MTVSIHNRAYRLLQSTPPISPKPADKRLKRSHEGPHQEGERGRPKESSSYSQRSTSPLSVVDINEELNFPISSCPVSVDQSNGSASSNTCGRSKSKKATRCVHFDNRLVTQVRTRPRTLPQDVHRLFYSSAEMNMFRKNYYAYLNSQRQEEVFEEEITTASLDNCKLETILNQTDISDVHNQTLKGMRKRHLVVKAVVSHQGETREYYHQEFQSPQSLSQGCGDKCSFDNSDFWNGTITWF